MVQIEIDEGTFQRLSAQARAQGFADVPSYLGGLADEDDGFVMTPEIEAALEEGLEDLRQGRVFGEETIREDMARLRRERIEKAA